MVFSGISMFSRNFYILFSTLAQLFKTLFALTVSLSPQFVNYISTSKANTLLVFVEKM